MADDCIFCAIVAGTIPSETITTDDEFIAIRDIAPKSDVHLLVMPREHHANLDEWIAAGGSSDRMLAFVAAVAQDARVAGRYRLITNVGPKAGQVVPHLHWHILAGDSLPGF
jgi:histidine triad (HIT) family protein